MQSAGVSRISHIQINSSDFRKSVAFYELLGFRVDRIISDSSNTKTDVRNLDTVPLRVGQFGKCYTVGMGLGDDPKAITKLEITEWVEPRKQNATQHPTDLLGVVRIAFTVRGLESLVETLKSHNHELEESAEFRISPTLLSRYVHLFDPDGCMLTLTEWIKS